MTDCVSGSHAVRSGSPNLGERKTQVAVLYTATHARKLLANGRLSVGEHDRREGLIFAERRPMISVGLKRAVSYVCADSRAVDGFTILAHSCLQSARNVKSRTPRRWKQAPKVERRFQ